MRLLRFPSDRVTALAAGPDRRLLIGGSSDGRVAEIGPDLSREGTFQSEILDAGSVAQWGRVACDAELPRGTRLAVRVRTGNTAEPDQTWSEWTEVPFEQGRAGGRIDAPAARWLQAEVRLAAERVGATPVVRALEVYYLPRNRPPRIERLSVGAAGEGWSRLPQQSPLGRPVVAEDPVSRRIVESLQPGRAGAAPVRKFYEAGARTFSWTASDPDGDTLVYALEIRREGEESWFALASEVEDDFYTWDSRGLGDGRYRLRLTARDRRSNAAGRDLAATRVSDPFLVDNTPPEIVDLDLRRTAGGFEVRFRAEDPAGRVAAAEFAFGEEPWRSVEPVDGVADSENEEYRVAIPHGQDEGKGGATAGLRLRVTDASGNVSGASRPLPR
jgi:hypothetical protein